MTEHWQAAAGAGGRREDRADQPGRAGAARRLPARLRRAVRRHGRARRGRGRPSTGCSSRRSRPRSRSCSAGTCRTSRSPSVDVIRAIDYLLPAIEIVDSRIADWDISIVDTVADNASSGLFVLGTAPRRARRTSTCGCAAWCWSTRGEPVSVGAGAACLGNPLHAVAWLASTLARAGDPLRAGRRGALRRARPDGAGHARAPLRGADLRARLGARRRLQRRGGSSVNAGVAVHRLGQHRHRPDDQGPAAVGDAADGGDGRHRPGLRRPGAGARAGRGDHRRGRRRPGGDARVRRRRAWSSTPPRPARTGATTRCCARTARSVIDLTPAAIGPYVVPAGQPRRAPGRAATSTW